MGMRHVAVVAGLALGLMSGAAKASYIFTFSQVGDSVVVNGTGEINTSILSFARNGGQGGSFVYPFRNSLSVGGVAQVDVYTANYLSETGSLGNGGFTEAESGAGDYTLLQTGNNLIIVPLGYTSGSLISGSSTFTDASFASLGLAQGITTFTYGAQAPSSGSSLTDTIEIVVPAISTVPLPSSAPMFGAALLALGAAGYAAKCKKEVAAA